MSLLEGDMQSSRFIKFFLDVLRRETVDVRRLHILQGGCKFATGALISTPLTEDSSSFINKAT